MLRERVCVCVGVYVHGVPENILLFFSSSMFQHVHVWFCVWSFALHIFILITFISGSLQREIYKASYEGGSEAG